MLQTFKAILRGNCLEWTEETPDLGDQPIMVHITIVQDNLSEDTASRGQKMAEILEKLAANNAFAGVDPIAWQRDVRSRRHLPGRDS
ncbi:hypothetical protein ICL16_17380 [Iningainema sp. BLCCT55]|uniref:Uncharacterized protein n=2 Tax=Iningainema TaxID=1932705 RepID=A0A8J6XLE8_9CYAN|nr:hypothetical protein [Iningainema tapete]MBD2773794.1 hypothetical protein [Iningainema tapete BLCC-T55]